MLKRIKEGASISLKKVGNTVTKQTKSVATGYIAMWFCYGLMAILAITFVSSVIGIMIKEIELLLCGRAIDAAFVFLLELVFTTCGIEHIKKTWGTEIQQAIKDKK